MSDDEDAMEEDEEDVDGGDVCAPSLSSPEEAEKSFEDDILRWITVNTNLQHTHHPTGKRGT